VRARLLSGPLLLGRMNCGMLTLSTNDSGQRLHAEYGVRIEQLPALNAKGNWESKTLNCEVATMLLRTNGLVQSMIAESNVVVTLADRPTDRDAPTLTELAAEILTAVFAPNTNQVDTVVAERSVVITQETGGAQGDKAVYDRRADSLLVTGNVVLKRPRLTLSSPAAMLKHFGLWPSGINRPANPSPRRPAADASPIPPTPAPPQSNP
jgi:hypothetical protein